jgi:hypothetical protein
VKVRDWGHGTYRPGECGCVTRGSAPGSTETVTARHPIPKQTPDVIAWLRAGPIHFDADNTSDAPSAPGASHTSSVDSSGTSVPHGTATNRGMLEGTRTMLPMLMADNATKGKYGGVTRHATGQQMIELTRYDSCHPSTTF